MRKLVLFAVFGFRIAACAQSKVDLAAGWDFNHADQGNGFADLNGWWASATYNLSSKVGLGFINQNYYGSYRGISQNQHAYMAGPTFTFGSEQRKVRPYIQPVIGDVRSSYAGSVSNNFGVQIAAGFVVKMGQKLGLNISPAQYAYVRQNGMNLNSYQAAVGLQLSLGK